MQDPEDGNRIAVIKTFSFLQPAQANMLFK